jgi:hypothetical protein
MAMHFAEVLEDDTKEPDLEDSIDFLSIDKSAHELPSSETYIPSSQQGQTTSTFFFRNRPLVSSWDESSKIEETKYISDDSESEDNDIEIHSTLGSWLWTFRGVACQQAD